MNDHALAVDPVIALNQHLEGGVKRLDFDMDDSPDFIKLEPFPLLHDALELLETTVADFWRKVDRDAILYQTRHRWLAGIAAATGSGAIILAVVQLALKQSWPSLTFLAAWLEGLTVLACFVSVLVGLCAKSDRKWLDCRHRAERLRMLKFKALSRVELWNEEWDQWQAWVKSQIQTLLGSDDPRQVEQWANDDSAEAEPQVSENLLPSHQHTRRALVVYYRHKRLLYQAAYFELEGKQAAASWEVKLRRRRELLFFVTIAFVLFHFAAHSFANHIDKQDHAAAARAWELASVWGLVVAAGLPVAAIGVRAWSAAFELARKARCFEAKRRALVKAVERLGNGTDELPLTLGHISHSELFLEQEHREWLRLLLEAEWFL